MVTLRLMSFITELSSLPGWLALQPAIASTQINVAGTQVIFIGDLSLCCLNFQVLPEKSDALRASHVAQTADPLSSCHALFVPKDLCTCFFPPRRFSLLSFVI